MKVCRLRALLLVALIATSSIADELESRLAQGDVRIARRLASVALKADKGKQQATARRLFERVIELDADNAIARGKLGFKRVAGSWERSSADAAKIYWRKDTDIKRVAKYRAERKKLESLRAKEVLKITAKHGTPESARPHLVALLRYVPRDRSVHAALGHESIGGVYARPELADLARAMPERVAAWRACGKPAEAKDTGRTIKLPGGSQVKALFQVGEREVVSGYKKKNGLYVARRTDGAKRLMDLLFPADMWRYDPKRVYFISKTQYENLIRSNEETDAARERGMRFSSYRLGDDGIAILTGKSNARALDRYLHCVAFWTMAGVISPVKENGKRDWNRYAWFKEGTALLITLEVMDSATGTFISTAESTGKAAPSLPLPDPTSRDACVAFVREQYYDGTFPPMREIFGSSLNNLDRARAMYAWTLIRFLALYDPDGFRKFPGCLYQETEGSQADRAMRALKKAFGKSANELLRLWEAYLLELS